MRILTIGGIVLGAVSFSYAQSQTRPTIANEEDFRRAMKELCVLNRSLKIEIVENIDQRCPLWHLFAAPIN